MGVQPGINVLDQRGIVSSQYSASQWVPHSHMDLLLNTQHHLVATSTHTQHSEATSKHQVPPQVIFYHEKPVFQSKQLNCIKTSVMVYANVFFTDSKVLRMNCTIQDMTSNGTICIFVVCFITSLWSYINKFEKFAHSKESQNIFSVIHT